MPEPPSDQARRPPSLKWPQRLIATGFFSGYSPIAPGTAGSGIALLIYWLLPALDLMVWIGLLLLLFLVGVYTAGAGEKTWGKDPGYVVIDEIAGVFTTLFWLPQSFWLGLAGFFLFRVLDIVKPPPARQAEALPGGWGVMMDDIIAGIYGNLILRGILVFWKG